MLDDFTLADDDLIDNPTSRVPIILCLDTSGSMTGEPIRELTKGVELFYQSVSEDEIARFSAEIGVITFGYGGVQCTRNFESVESNPHFDFQAGGGTPMGKAIMDALEMLEERKKAFQRAGVDYFQPWLVLMTDGQPTDDIDCAVEHIVNLIESKKLSLFPIGIGTNADMQVLERFSPARTPLRLRGLEFKKFFEWLSASVQQVSKSIPGQEVPLDIDGIQGWGHL